MKFNFFFDIKNLNKNGIIHKQIKFIEINNLIF